MPIDQVYDYLEKRYNSTLYADASEQTKGYMPKIEIREATKNSFLSFYVKGHDPFTGLSVGSWKWSYTLTQEAGGMTKLKIAYEYGLFMSFISGGTVGHQAANEICETALALDALSNAQLAQ